MSAPFRVSRRVDFCDTDMAGIIHFSNFFRYMEFAEVAFLRLARSVGGDDVGRGTSRLSARVGDLRFLASGSLRRSGRDRRAGRARWPQVGDVFVRFQHEGQAGGQGTNQRRVLPNAPGVHGIESIDIPEDLSRSARRGVGEWVAAEVCGRFLTLLPLLTGSLLRFSLLHAFSCCRRGVKIYPPPALEVDPQPLPIERLRRFRPAFAGGV